MAKIDKSKWNKNIKVSQDMIDTIKGMGMKKALGMLDEYSNPKVKNISGNKVYIEAVRRLYGETRFQNNLYKAKNSPGPASTSYSPGPYKASKPKSGGTSNSKVK
jgi:5'-3' exonuclease